MIPLFEKFPELKTALPHVSFGTFPTPVKRLINISEQLDTDISVKDDGLSGKLYGGNKIRKLEFLLADALKNNASHVLTFGCIGSNHALATAVYAHSLNIKSISMLFHQPAASYIRKNLLLGSYYNADLVYIPSFSKSDEYTTAIIEKYEKETGKIPFIIPAGGTNELGAVGFVNAAFELKKQIKDNIIKKPDIIYIPLGTMGSAAGLAVGLKAAGLDIHIIAVRVVNKHMAHYRKFSALCNTIVAFLKAHSSNFPDIAVTRNDITIEDNFFGTRYARATQDGKHSCELFEKYENISLETTYTGKCAAALIYNAKKNKHKNRSILFWKTLNSIDISQNLSKVDMKNIPDDLKKYL